MNVWARGREEKPCPCPWVPIWSRRSAVLGRCLAACVRLCACLCACVDTCTRTYMYMGATPCSLPPPSAGARVLFDVIWCYLFGAHPRSPGVPALPGTLWGPCGWRSRRVPRAGPAPPALEGAPWPCPGLRGPWAARLESKHRLSPHARHELVESCDSPDAFLDIHSSYSASGEEGKITGSTSVCVGGGGERTTDNAFV